MSAPAFTAFLKPGYRLWHPEMTLEVVEVISRPARRFKLKDGNGEMIEATPMQLWMFQMQPPAQPA